MNLVAVIRQRPRIFYGWWIVALAGFVASINNTAVKQGYAVFFLPVSESLGVSRASISLVFSISRSEGGTIGPIAGWFIDRFGPKSILFAGTVICGSGFLLVSQSQNIWTFGLFYLAMVGIGSEMLNNALHALVNNWFIRRRALAMSSYKSMDFLGPALLVPLLALLITLQGWRTASIVAGVILLGVALPLLLLVRNTPERAGMLPDGGPAIVPSEGQSRNPGGETSSIEAQPADFDLREAFHTPAYWLLLYGNSLRRMATAGVMLHIIPILVWKGIEEQTAAYIFGLLLFITVPINLFMGLLADIFPKNLVLSLAAVAGTMAFSLLASPWSSIWIIYLFVFLLSIAETLGTINSVTLGDYFGRKSFGRLRGIMHFAGNPGIFLAGIFAGWWYDQMQSYTLPLWVFTILIGLGALSFALIRKPEKVHDRWKYRSPAVL